MQLPLVVFAVLRAGQALAPPATTMKKTRRRTPKIAAPTLGDVEPLTVLAADAVIDRVVTAPLRRRGSDADHSLARRSLRFELTGRRGGRKSAKEITCRTPP